MHLSTSEIWPVGCHSAVFSTATRAVALLNGSAASIWELYAERQDIGAVAEAVTRHWGLAASDAIPMIAGLVDKWRTAGLIRIGPDTTAQKPAARPLDGIDAGLYATHAGRFRLTCEDPAAAVVMAAVLAPLSAGPGSDACETRIDLHGFANRYWTARDGIALCSPGNISFARHEVLKQLLIDPAVPDRCTAVLHAAAVRIADHAVVSAGDCGRGKSTLTGCLVHDGAGYIGDDLLALDRDGRHIGVCPVALSVKIGSWPVLAPLHLARLSSPEITINDYRLRYIDLSHRAPVEPRVPVGAIVFPNYMATATFAAEAIEPERSLQMLLDSGSRTAGDHPTMEGLCRLADQTPAWRLTYSDWRDAARFIGERLAAPAPNRAHR